MFDALLGRKFTAKCKHAIKCICERLKPIRNRQQAMVNFLRSDIADLLRNGNAEHAFGRMDGLITDLNRLACYDMIEKFCECLLTQLPLLQKTSECPPEDREAMSTLIFAAARFSDLPELCELRHIFATRYGSAMETSVNPEFKDKSASKTFSVNRKLQLMKEIASEFSINWDSKSFEYRMTHPTVSKHDQPKKLDAHQEPKILPVNEKEGVFKHVVTKAKDIQVTSHQPEHTRKTMPWVNEPKNVTPAPIDSSNPCAKTEKDNYANSTEDWRRKNDMRRVPSRSREVLDPINHHGKVVEPFKSKDDYRDESKVPPDTRKLHSTNVEFQTDGATVYKRSSRAQVMLDSNGEEGGVMEPLKSKESRGRYVPLGQQELNGINAKESHGILYKRSSRAIMDYKAEQKQAVGQEEYWDDDQPRGVRQYAKPKGMNDVTSSDGWEKDGIDAKESHDIVYKRSSRTKMDYEAGQKQAVGQQEIEDNDKPKKNPQYSKPRGMNDVTSLDSREKDFTRERSGKARQVADVAAVEGHMNEPQTPSNRAFHTIPPPYVKTVVSKAGSNSEHTKSSSQPTHDFAASDKPSSHPTHESVFHTGVKSNNGVYKDLPKAEFVADDERPKPKSVRRKQQKPPVVQEVDSMLHSDGPVSGTPHGQRRRSSRQNMVAPQDNYDEEEMVMDKLLVHYCKKGMPGQSNKHRTRTPTLPPDHTLQEGEHGQNEISSRYRTHKVETVQAAHPDYTINTVKARGQQYYGRCQIPKAESAQALPADHVVQDGETVLSQAYGRYRVHRPESVHPPERAVSLPRDPITPKEVSRGPARTTSMQPNSPILDGHTHSQLPGYEELAARFAALKKG